MVTGGTLRHFHRPTCQTIEDVIFHFLGFVMVHLYGVDNFPVDVAWYCITLRREEETLYPLYLPGTTHSSWGWVPNIQRRM